MRGEEAAALDSARLAACNGKEKGHRTGRASGAYPPPPTPLSARRVGVTATAAENLGYFSEEAPTGVPCRGYLTHTAAFQHSKVLYFWVVCWSALPAGLPCLPVVCLVSLSVGLSVWMHVRRRAHANEWCDASTPPTNPPVTLSLTQLNRPSRNARRDMSYSSGSFVLARSIPLPSCLTGGGARRLGTGGKLDDRTKTRTTLCCEGGGGGGAARVRFERPATSPLRSIACMRRAAVRGGGAV